ncbi:MAG: hypothetical protein RMJ98_08975 [Myxococcales bacterium]|nr:hypothetical protein [Myxococcales bacterium]
MGETWAQEGLRLEQSDVELRASVGQQLRWSYRLPQRKGQPSPGPLLLGDTVVFCHGGQLYEATAATGTIQRRMVLPGACTDLVARAPGYEVRCQGGSGSYRWERVLTLSPGQGDPGTVLPSEFPSLFALKRQAEEVAGKNPADRESALSRLEQLRKQDPTNPWIDFKRAELLRAAGQEEEAQRAIASALSLDVRYDSDLLMLATPLMAFSPEASTQAFRRGMKRLLERGYEPELATTALIPMVLLGRIAEEGKPVDLGNDQDRARLLLRAELLLDLAPNSEGSTWFFAALEQDAVRRGDREQAARWRPLAQRTVGTSPFVPTPPESEHAGVWVQFAAALAAAILACTLIKSIRSFSLRYAEEAPWWKRANPFSRWDRRELIGFLVAVAVMVGVSWKAAQGVAILGAAASAPTSLASGNPGHPESRAYLDASPDGPTTRFFRAFAAHRAGDLETAERLYRQLGTPEALANLGAIARVRGDLTKAQELWKQALGRKPDLDAALHNLGQPTTSPRAERFRRYQVDAPLLAAPSEQDWGQLWREHVATTTSTNPLHISSLLDSLYAASSGEGIRLAPVYTATLVDLLLVGLALLALFFPGKLEPGKRAWALVGAGLSALVPGASRIYGPVSCFVGALVLFLMAGSQMLASSEGQSVTLLGSLSGVNWSQYHGAALVKPELASWHGAIRWWWVLLLVNLLLVLAFDLRQAFREGREHPG